MFLLLFFQFALGVANFLFALLRFPGPVDVFWAFLLVFSRVLRVCYGFAVRCGSYALQK